MLVVLCAVSVILVGHAYSRTSNAQALQAQVINASAAGAAHEIELHLKVLRTSVSLFTEKERQLLQRLAANSGSPALYEQLLIRVKEDFTDAITISLANDHGDLLIQNSASSAAVHFDVMVPVSLNSGGAYIFFVSFSPQAIAEILHRHQLESHRLLLLNREANDLIEVTAEGSRETLQRDYFLRAEEQERVQMRIPVAATQWELIDLPDASVFQGVSEEVWQETAAELFALIAISVYFLYSMRKYVNRIEAQSAALRTQAGEIQQRSAKVIDILERTTDAYLELDSDWRCTYINRQAGKLFDLAAESALGRDIFVARPDLVDFFYTRLQKARTDGMDDMFEGYYPRSKRWLETHVYPLHNRMTVFMRDVTPERLAWEQAKNSEVRVRAILDNVADAIIVIDKSGCIETFNAAAERIFGYAEGEALGRNVSMIMPSPQREEHDQYITRYLNNGISNLIGKTRELTGRRKDGALFPVELCVTHVHTNERDIFIGALRDICERKKVEERIRELAKFPEENPTPVLRVGSDGVVAYANRAAEILLHSWDTMVEDQAPSDIVQTVREALAAGAPIEREARCFDQVYSMVFSPTEEGHYVNVRGRDITDRKRVEEELKEHRDRLEELVSERTAALVMAHNDALVASREKSAFLASMSHELRTPLNAIIGYSEMLGDVANDEGHLSLGVDLKKITAAGRHLLKLINDILDLSKIEAGKMQFALEHFLLSHILTEIETTIRPMVAKNENRFDIVIDGEIGSMYSDATRIKQVLLNVLSNACKFTKNGRITLMVRRETLEQTDWLSFVVNDTGIGMSPLQVHRLFEPFIQGDSTISTKYGGTGLGLAISRRICQLLGGEIRVHSETGVGSSFTVRLPTEAVPQIEPLAPLPV